VSRVVVCLSVCSTVTQKPTDLLKNKNDSVTLECFHNISSYNVILWYKQSEHRDLQLLGFLYRGNINKDSGLNRSIELNGDGSKSSTLMMGNLTSNDSAVYYCAASKHST
uniref:Ig-like domain-containing protein n=1 Tax=Pygocentrus nattereri TaxID=42514 RepID=A0A3B4BYS6_PYGNA